MGMRLLKWGEAKMVFSIVWQFDMEMAHTWSLNTLDVWIDFKVHNFWYSYTFLFGLWWCWSSYHVQGKITTYISTWFLLINQRTDLHYYYYLVSNAFVVIFRKLFGDLHGWYYMVFVSMVVNYSTSSFKMVNIWVSREA